MTPFFSGFQCLQSPGSVCHPQLTVDGRWCSTPDPGTNNERIGFFGDQQLQLGCHSFGRLTGSQNNVFTIGIAGCQR